jgi:hypothetical protein
VLADGITIGVALFCFARVSMYVVGAARVRERVMKNRFFLSYGRFSRIPTATFKRYKTDTTPQHSNTQHTKKHHPRIA